MSKRRSKSKFKQREERQQQIIYGVLVVVALVIVGGIAYSVLNQPPEVTTERLSQEAHLGANAPVVQIVEYGSYGCHACRQVHQSGYIEQVLDRYGEQVQFVFRNLPIIHPNDAISSEAAQCALDQGEDNFWHFHEALYEMSDRDYEGMSRADDYVTLAKNLGLDSGKLDSCLAENTHARTVDYWEDDGQKLLIRGTPTFFVNGQRLNSVGELEAIVLRNLGGN